MATYTYEGPQENQKDEIRFLLQDVREEEWQLSDEEIGYAIAKWESYWSTSEGIASVLADTLAARYAREATISADGVNISLAQVAQQYRDLAANLRAQHKSLLVGGLPDAGGISPYEERSHDIRNFSFGTGMHDDLEAGPQDYGDRGQSPYYNSENMPGA
jgi:single-stranded DNA-specific DHH superfamily exonuclease